MNSPTRKPITPELLFPNRYLAADDLGTKTATVQIKDITLEKPQRRGGKKRADEPEMSGVLHFAGKKKVMLINPTNTWSLLLLLAPAGGRDITTAIGKRVVIGTDIDVNLNDGGESPCLRIIGSPDADPERTKLFNKAWHGKRTRGDLVARIKLATKRLGASITANVAPPDPETVPTDAGPAQAEESFDEEWGDGEGPGATAPAAAQEAAPPKPSKEELASKVAGYVSRFDAVTDAKGLRSTVDDFLQEHEDVQFDPAIHAAKDKATARIHGGAP